MGVAPSVLPRLSAALLPSIHLRCLTISVEHELGERRYPLVRAGNTDLKPTFFDRWGRYILVFTLAMVPGIFYCAGKAVQSNVNKVEDWLPKTFNETKQLAWFRKHFASDQFVVISWEGCEIGELDSPDAISTDDPRIERLAQLLVAEGETEPLKTEWAPVKPVTDELKRDAARFFKSVTTGRRILERLTAEPLNLDAQEAVKRLKGSLLGPDGRQTCVVVSLHHEALSHLKQIMGVGQYRIFRPSVPPGLLRQMIMAAGLSLDEVHLGGPPVDNAAIDEEGERTLVRLAGVSGLLGLVLAYWALRSFLLTMIVFSAGVVSAAASLGTVWLGGQTIDAILMSMPSLVYVLSISGAVHLINYYRDAIREGGLHGAVERAVSHAWKPAALSSITTALGLISLYASELVPIQKFGLYSAIGMLTLVGILFLFLPAALHVTKIGKRWVEPEDVRAARARHDAQPALETLTVAERFWRWFSGKIVANHALVMTSCLTIIAVIGWGITRNTTSINLLELFDSKARILRDYAWLEENLGVLVPLEIVLKFEPTAVLASDATHHESAEDLYRLTFLERMETVARVQEMIAAKFGTAGQDIVGSSMSALSFAPALPTASGNTLSFMHRKALNMRLDSSRREFMDAGFLQIDPQDGCELWRISLRVAAFKGVDYGQLVTDMKHAVQPVIQAYVDRNRILRQVAAWSTTASYTGARVMLWDRTQQTHPESTAATTAQTDPHVGALNSMLVNARCRVYTSDVDPSSITLTKLESLKATDAVVLVGEFTESDMRTIAGSIPQTIVAGDHAGSRARRQLAGDPGIGDRAPEMDAVYTGVVPIVYKAQRALLESLIQSTLWSFLTITPLMMIVSRSFAAGGVAMIPNVLPVVVIFGAMGWLGISIDIGSMMTASIALGVAVDDTIHFLSWYRADLDRSGDRREAIVSCYAKCATPTLQAALISGLGLSVFALSTFTPTQRFGWLMLSILVAGVVAELIMLPALLAGPLGVVFKAHSARHTLPSRLYLIARYRYRRWRVDAQCSDELNVRPQSRAA